MQETETVIDLNGLTKIFKKAERPSVDHLTLRVEKGEIFGFVGPNGAGKTTTMKMMIGLLEPTDGAGKVLGYDIVRDVIRIRETTGFLPEPAGFYDHLTARQNLRFYARLYNMDENVREKRIEEILTLVGLERAIDQKIGGFSTGMRKRFGLAQALINEPAVLFLDEPTSGIDPKGAQMMRDLVRTLSREKGVTVFLSSHSMTEVEEICDRIGIMNRGCLIAAGTVEELRDIIRRKEGMRYVLDVSDTTPEKLAESLRLSPGITDVAIEGNRLHIHMKNDDRHTVADIVKNGGGTLLLFEEEKPSLQSIFMKLIGENE